MKDIYKTVKGLAPRKLRRILKPMYMKWSLRHFTSPTSIKMKDFNCTIRLDPQNRAIDEYIYIHRNWETDIAQVLVRELHTGDVFIDVGANIGAFTMPAATLVGQEGRVISFEPIKRVANQCHNSARDNGFSQVVVKQMAMGNQVGQLELEIVPGNIGGSSLVKNLGTGQGEKVPISTLDRELDDLDHIDLIKIDVEGYEYESLLGGQEILRKHQPNIIMEFSPRVYARQTIDHSRDILELLVSLGYHIEDLDYGYPCVDIDQYLKDLNTEQTNLFLSVR